MRERQRALHRTGRAGDAAQTERAMFVVRVVAAVFFVLHVTIVAHRPGWVPPAGYALAGGLLGSALLLRFLGRLTEGRERAQAAVARLGLSVDAVVVMGLVCLYTYDKGSALWALLLAVPLEGAMLFGLRGALGSMAAVSVLYALRELVAQAAYGYPFLVSSVVSRLGIGAIIALIAGLSARKLIRDREGAEAALVRLEEHDQLKDEFVSTASHELRTPITVISGFAQTLRRTMDLPERRRAQYLDAIIRQSDRMARLAGDILDITRLDRGKLPIRHELVSVREICARTAETLGEPVEIKVPADLKVWADPMRTEQIVFNLLENAVKYGRPPYQITARRQAYTIAVSVADHGDGIVADEREQVFELFYRSGDNEQKGSGVGLTVSRRLAEAQDGALTYEPNVPSGARFTLYLPAGHGARLTQVGDSRRLTG